MLCLAGKLGLKDWTLVPGLCTAGGRPLGEWAPASGLSCCLAPGLPLSFICPSEDVCPSALQAWSQAGESSAEAEPCGLPGCGPPAGAMQPSPGQEARWGPGPQATGRPARLLGGGWPPVPALQGSEARLPPSKQKEAETEMEGGTGRGSSCRPGLGCGGSAGGPSLGPPRCLSLQLALTHRGGCVSAQVAQALPAGTWVSHGEGPPGQRGPGSSSAQPGQEGRRPPPESSAAPSAAPAAQTLRPAPVTPSSLLSSRLSGAPLFPWVSGRPQGFLFVPAHPDLHTAVEDGVPASPGRFRHQGQAGGRPGRPPAGLQWAPSRPLLHSLSQTLPPRKPRPAQWSEPPRERPRQAPARPGPRRPPAGLQEPAVNSWWLRPPYSDSTDPRG